VEISPLEFFDALADNSIDFFSGVPDSLLKEFCFCIDDRAAKQKHIIAANEGNAIALAAGYHLATDKIPLVYMQNAGFGNAINPLLSLCDRNVYSIPMLIVIGWRGEPEVGDEPQHVKQGKVTLKLFDLLDIPYRIMPDTNSEVKDCLDHLIKIASAKKTPVALVVKKNTFKEYKLEQKKDTLFELTREESIKLIVGKLNPVDIVVSTTGKTSRELYEYREQLQQGHNKDFLVIGSMGHSSQIALAIALEKPLRQVFCLDGDGSVIMHMGSLAIIGSQKVSNFKHIIINNGSHDSVGGQPTVGFSISFVNIAKACGYKTCLGASTANDIGNKVEILKAIEGPALLEIKVRGGSRIDLGRPKAIKKNKDDFMKFLSE